MKSKPTVARASETSDAEKQSISLADVEITWSRDAHFFGEEGPKQVTISGKALAVVLDWMARSAPGRPTEFDSPEHIADMLEGIGELCRATVDAEYAHHRSILYTLGEVIDDLAHRVTAHQRADKIVKTAQVRIRPQAESKAEA